MNRETKIELSVVVPAYNVEDYLRKCLDTLISQPLSLEIILVNDGSTDSTGDIAKEYAEKHSCVKLINQSNQGLSAARNKGLEVATGEYIAFVDSDDWVVEDGLAVMYTKAKENRLDMIRGNVIYAFSDGRAYNPFKQIDPDFINSVLAGKEYFIASMQSDACLPMVWSSLYNREWLSKIDLSFENLVHEDELWTPMAICQANRMMVIDLGFYYYRQREGSIMQTLHTEKRIKALFEICRQLVSFTSRWEDDRDLQSWLFVKVFELYRIAFSLLPKMKSSDFCLPHHHLYCIFQYYKIWEKKPRARCLQNYHIAKRGLRGYHRQRLSPWFKTPAQICKQQTLILIYNGMWNVPLPVRPEELPDDCIITTDRSFFAKADAVVFHMPTLRSELDADLEKPEKQLWVAWSMESEENYPFLKNPEFMDLFDLRMTYHQDADIIQPYYSYTDLQDLYYMDDSPLKKENTACMLISSPINQSGRIGYLKELMQYTSIDSYGKLFQTKEMGSDRGRESKMELYGKYKFVIAFENSIANDYVTEKFFDPLLAGSVPIYLGAPNIDEFAPGDNCFVDVRKYESPRHLADFLNACYQDDTLYMDFLRWKQQPLLASFREKAEKQKENPFVALCHKAKEKTNSFA